MTDIAALVKLLPDFCDYSGSGETSTACAVTFPGIVPEDSWCPPCQAAATLTALQDLVKEAATALVAQGRINTREVERLESKLTSYWAQAEAIAEAQEIMHEVARTVASDTNGTTKGAATSILNARVLPQNHRSPHGDSMTPRVKHASSTLRGHRKKGGTRTLCGIRLWMHGRGPLIDNSGVNCKRCLKIIVHPTEGKDD